MNRTTTVLVALIAAAALSTMPYTVPEQRALAWGSFGGCGFGFGGCGGFFPGGCGFGCGGFFGFHKHIIQTISQTNTCHGNSDDQKAYSNDDQDQRNKQTVCINTAVNHVGPGFVSVPSIPNFNPPDNQPPAPDNDHKQPGKEVAIGGNGGSGGAGGSGGEGGQGGKNAGYISSTSEANVNQKANGGNSNGGHAGNANGGNATT
jgi:hypothetical protein